MRVINAESVSDALSQGLHHLRVHGHKQPSRNGDVIVSPMPVITIYKNPRNRVLFSPMRDANPFFHVMETLWMLAGRNDLPWLQQFNSKFGQYSDDGGRTQPGAYGYRWRNYFGYDQLETLICELRQNPQTRRAVLAMWDGGHIEESNVFNETTEWSRDGDLLAAIGGSADVPCNTHCYFDTIDGKLNMTVCCRSNDIIWGAYGANAVHFSFLLEYVASATGLPMGVMRQFSNNYHLYTAVVPENKIMPLARDVEASDKGIWVGASLIPLRAQHDDFSQMLDDWLGFEQPRLTTNAFLDMVATPMLKAYMAFKSKEPDRYEKASSRAGHIADPYWRKACTEWLGRRADRAREQ